MNITKYQIFCQTDNRWEDILIEEGKNPAMACPLNASHSVLGGSLKSIGTYSNVTKQNKNGAVLTDLTLRAGNATTENFTIVTHEFSDRSTWYQKSILATDEPLVDTGNGLSFQAASGKRSWVNIHSPKLTVDKKKILERTGALSDYSKYEVTVKIDGVAADPATYEIDFLSGTVTFDSSQSGASITASYYYNEGVTNASEFILKPAAGKLYRLEHVETQFSRNTVFTNAVEIEIWAGGALESYGDFSNKESPYLVNRSRYRSFYDLINWCNNQYPVIPVAGVSGFTSDILVFPFVYIVANEIRSSQGTLIRVLLSEDTPLTSEISTVTFYMERESE